METLAGSRLLATCADAQRPCCNPHAMRGSHTLDPASLLRHRRLHALGADRRLCAPGSGQSALDRAVAAADRDAQGKDGAKKKKCAPLSCS